MRNRTNTAAVESVGKEKERKSDDFARDISVKNELIRSFVENRQFHRRKYAEPRPHYVGITTTDREIPT